MDETKGDKDRHQCPSKGEHHRWAEPLKCLWVLIVKTYLNSIHFCGHQHTEATFVGSEENPAVYHHVHTT